MSFDAHSSTSDHALLERLRRDDPAALGDMMRVYTPVCYRVAYAIVVSRAAAEDIVQDVFVYVWERRHTIGQHDNLRAYLLRATRSRALNVLRHERSQWRIESVLASSPGPTSTSNAGVSHLEQAELARVVHAAFSSLPPRTREIFVLRRREGMSYDAIAETLGVGEPTIRNRMSLATKALAAAVRRWMGDGGE
jgi:RNA polymerase sigma-70 factor (ECF subfamily)